MHINAGNRLEQSDEGGPHATGSRTSEKPASSVNR